MNYGPLIPTLKVASIPESLSFYRDVLGFSIKWTWSEANGFDTANAATFACIESGEAVAFLSRDDGGVSSSLFVELPFVEDVDALATRLRGLVSLEEPADRPWGSRELSLRDPNGHSFRFSCPIERRAPGGLTRA